MVMNAETDVPVGASAETRQLNKEAKELENPSEETTPRMATTFEFSGLTSANREQSLYPSVALNYGFLPSNSSPAPPQISDTFARSDSSTISSENDISEINNDHDDNSYNTVSPENPNPTSSEELGQVLFDRIRNDQTLMQRFHRSLGDSVWKVFLRLIKNELEHQKETDSVEMSDSELRSYTIIHRLRENQDLMALLSKVDTNKEWRFIFRSLLEMIHEIYSKNNGNYQEDLFRRIICNDETLLGNDDLGLEIDDQPHEIVHKLQQDGVIMDLLNQIRSLDEWEKLFDSIKAEVLAQRQIRLSNSHKQFNDNLADEKADLKIGQEDLAPSENISHPGAYHHSPRAPSLRSFGSVSPESEGPPPVDAVSFPDAYVPNDFPQVIEAEVERYVEAMRVIGPDDDVVVAVPVPSEPNGRRKFRIKTRVIKWMWNVWKGRRRRNSESSHFSAPSLSNSFVSQLRPGASSGQQQTEVEAEVGRSEGEEAPEHNQLVAPSTFSVAEWGLLLGRIFRNESSLTALNVKNISDERTRSLANALERNSFVTFVSLSNSRIACVGARSLGTMLRLNATILSLNLSYNGIDSSGVRALAEDGLAVNSVLADLDLSNNNISSEGACFLAESLRLNDTLSTLNLRQNDLCDEGGNILRDCLKENTSLVSVDLTNCGIDPHIELGMHQLVWRNRVILEHKRGIDEEGAAFYITDFHGHAVWTKEVWEISAGDGKACAILHEFLKRILSPRTSDSSSLSLFGSCSDTNRNMLKELVDECRRFNGSNILHIVAAQTCAEAFDLCVFLVETVRADFDRVVDRNNRTAQDIAVANDNKAVCEWARSVGRFLDRYHIQGGVNAPPLRKSATWTSHVATDTRGTNDREAELVTIKVFDEREQFNRELKWHLTDNNANHESGTDLVSCQRRFHDDHALNLLRYHDEEDRSGQRRMCLTFQRCDHSLHDIVNTEHATGRNLEKIQSCSKSIAGALCHVHNLGLVLTDVTPRNIVRIDGDYKLADFDTVARVGEVVGWRKGSTAYAPPELARDFLACDVESNEQPVTPPLAHQTMDIWSFGAILFHLLTGEALFGCDEDDGVTKNQGRQNWTTLTARQLGKVLSKESKPNEWFQMLAQDLLIKCLKKDPKDRLQTMDEVLSHPFLNSSMQSNDTPFGVEGLDLGMVLALMKENLMLEKFQEKACHVIYAMVLSANTQLRRDYLRYHSLENQLWLLGHKFSSCKKIVSCILGELKSITQKDIVNGREMISEAIGGIACAERIPFAYLQHTTNNFSKTHRIGSGSSSSVFMGKDAVSRRKFVVKKYKQTGKEDQLFRREKQILDKCYHPNIPKMYGSCEYGKDKCLVLEYAENGSLFDFLESKKKLHWAKRINIALDVAKALAFLHESEGDQQIFHRDVKSSNIVLKNNLSALLVDFGTTKMTDKEDSMATKNTFETGDDNTKGTPAYSCSHIDGEKGLLSSQDVFSLGIVFAELHTGVLQHSIVEGEKVNHIERYGCKNFGAYNLEKDHDEKSLEGPAPTGILRRFAGLTVECMSPDPNRRPTIKKVVERLETISSQARPRSPPEQNHIRVLAAKPLVYAMGKELFPASSPLDTRNEHSIILEKLNTSKTDINIEFDVATVDRLQAAVASRCGVLHISCHGHLHEDEASFLFEDRKGGALLLDKADISECINPGKTKSPPFKLVFLSACHSFRIGKAFVDAGVSHVICCRHEAGLLDEAAIEFTGTLYKALFELNTLSVAFKMAKGKVSAMFGNGESEKFQLLGPRTSGGHSVPIFNADKNEGMRAAKRPSCCIPRPPRPVVGREKDMYWSLQAILQAPVVTLVGRHPKIGCTSMACSLAEYVAFRKNVMPFDNVYFIQRRIECDWPQSFFVPLSEQLAAKGVIKHLDNTEHQLIGSLSGQRVFIVFDGVMEEDRPHLINFSRSLLSRNDHVKLLFTAAEPLGFPFPQERIFYLDALNLENTVNLFSRECPFVNSIEMRNCLFSGFVSECDAKLSSVGDMSPEGRKLFGELGHGMPDKILRIAGTMEKETFDKILEEANRLSKQTCMLFQGEEHGPSKYEPI